MLVVLVITEEVVAAVLEQQEEALLVREQQAQSKGIMAVQALNLAPLAQQYVRVVVVEEQAHLVQLLQVVMVKQQASRAVQ